MGNSSSNNPGGGGPLSSISNCCGREKELVGEDEIGRGDGRKAKRPLKPI